MVLRVELHLRKRLAVPFTDPMTFLHPVTRYLRKLISTSKNNTNANNIELLVNIEIMLFFKWTDYCCSRPAPSSVHVDDYQHTLVLHSVLQENLCPDGVDFAHGSEAWLLEMLLTSSSVTLVGAIALLDSWLPWNLWQEVKSGCRLIYRSLHHFLNTAWSGVFALVESHLDFSYPNLDDRWFIKRSSNAYRTFMESCAVGGARNSRCDVGHSGFRFPVQDSSRYMEIFFW